MSTPINVASPDFTGILLEAAALTDHP